jgi:competence ComEA-like helix-hairpin-helix protein
MLYSRPQLKLLLMLATAMLVGIGVREWRAGFPETAERLERFDREEPADPLLPLPRPERRPIPATAGAPPEQGPGAAPPGAAAAAADARPLDLNRASVGELARLPGVGPGLAERILAERERRGRFDSPEALRHVLGMGPKKLAAIRDLVTVDP